MGNKQINTFKCSAECSWGTTHTSKPVTSKQSSYTLIRSLGLLGDDLAFPMAASQLVFLHKCHFRSYQEPRTIVPAHLCSHKVPQTCILPSLARFPRIPCSSATIMSTSSELYVSMKWKNILKWKTHALAREKKNQNNQKPKHNASQIAFLHKEFYVSKTVIWQRYFFAKHLDFSHNEYLIAVLH